MGFVAESATSIEIPSSKRLQNRDATSKYCKLNSECFIQRTKNRKKFRINCRKDAIKSFEFICRISVVIAN